MGFPKEELHRKNGAQAQSGQLGYLPPFIYDL